MKYLDIILNKLGLKKFMAFHVCFFGLILFFMFPLVIINMIFVEHDYIMAIVGLLSYPIVYGMLKLFQAMTLKMNPRIPNTYGAFFGRKGR